MEMSDILKKHFTDVEAKVGPISEEVKVAMGRLDELEQKALKAGNGPGGDAVESPGRLVIENAEMKSFTGNNVIQGRRISVPLKAIISGATANATGSAGGLIVPYRDNIVPLPHRRLVVRDLLPVVPITSNAVQYPVLSSVTNAAATVSETTGVTKPQSDMQIALATVNVTTIAHWVLATRQILDDAPQLQGLIDQELLYGLAYVEDNMLFNGTGTGTDLNGIYTQATPSTANLMVVASPTKIDVIAAAIYQQNLTYLPADGIILNPADWTSMQLIKESTGGYILGDPASGAAPRLFNLPVVVTPAMAVGKFLVGSFRQGATLYDRMNARVETSTEDSTNFRQNLVTILAEERIAMAVRNTLAFTRGDFAAQIVDLTS